MKALIDERADRNKEKEVEASTALEWLKALGTHGVAIITGALAFRKWYDSRQDKTMARIDRREKAMEDKQDEWDARMESELERVREAHDSVMEELAFCRAQCAERDVTIAKLVTRLDIIESGRA